MRNTIGILTGGGDVPGLNPCIKAAVYRALDEGHRVIGIRKGWGGLLHCNPESEESIRTWTIPLTLDTVRTIDRTGGTFLHTSRTNPGRVRPSALPDFLRDGNTGSTEPLDMTPHVVKVLSRLGINSIIPIGGDDTLGYGHRIHQEGFPVVAVPKTMDNDVHGTDYCIGFSTAVTRSVDFITQLRTSMGSHERIGIVELFGRNSGETSLISAYLAGADRAVISEVPFSPEKLATYLEQDKASNPSNYAVMTISEGATMLGGDIIESGPKDAFGHRKLGGIGIETSKEIKRLTGSNIVFQQLAYLMRSGAPDALDRMVATNYGSLAIDLITQDITGRLVVLDNGRYAHKSLDVVAAGEKRVDVDMFYDVEEYRAKVTDVLGKPMFLS